MSKYSDIANGTRKYFQYQSRPTGLQLLDRSGNQSPEKHRNTKEDTITAKPQASLRALLAGAPRPLLSNTAEAALGTRHREVLDDLEEMLRNGELGSLTVGELATHLGCSRRTLYELAPSKEALYLLVFDRMMHRLGRTALSRIDAQASATEQLRQYTETSLGYTFESAAYEDLLDIPAIRRARERHHRFAASILERIIATGIGNGEFRPVDSLVAAHVILCSAVHLTTPDVVEDLGIPHDEAKRAMLDLLLDGLSAG